ncbi:MAG: arylsulfatase [Planctomycetota bacterium]|nr:arylsulfatase [Planctomycetota bacterium]
MRDKERRRTYLAEVICCSLAVFLILGKSAGAIEVVEEKTEKPNILLILADDLGWGELGSYGQTQIRTPRLDALAREGMRFTQAYSGSPVCASARCTLLTGYHTGNAAIRGNDEMGSRGDVWNDPALEGQRPLPEETETLGDVLQANGYVTACIGKWGLGWTGSTGDPNTQGFDHFYGYNCQRVAHNYYPTFLWRDGQKELLSNEAFQAHQRLPEESDANDPELYGAYSGEDYAPDLLLEDALDFMTDNADQPFLLYFASIVPHLALQVPDDSLDEYEDSFEETPYTGNAGYLPHRTPRAAYAAMITRMDRDIGRMLDHLETLGIADNTLVLFTSDNGPSWVGGVDREFFQSSGGLRGRKAQLYEGGIRVPLMVRWPGHVAPDSTTDQVAAFWDLLPTLVEAAGGSPSKEIDGISLMPTLRGDGQAQEQHPYLYWEYAKNRQAVRIGDWKVYRPRLSAPVEVYDLGNDPEETTDLAAVHPEIVVDGVTIMMTGRTRSEHFAMRWD